MFNNSLSHFTISVTSWLQALICERFGCNFELSAHTGKLQLLVIGSGTEGSISFDNLIPSFFINTTTELPHTKWNAALEGWSSVLGKPLPAPGTDSLSSPLIEQMDGKHTIHYDILGLIYWMLSRREEVGRTDLDMYNRFPATSSHAFKNGYLDRPLVDEWLHILGQVIQRQWPGIELKEHRFCMKVSHDVDHPSRYGFRTIPGLVKAMGGDILKRRDLKNAIHAPLVWKRSKRMLHESDPFNTFDWIMDISEQNNLESAFYFICGRTDPSKDAYYEPEHPAIRNLLRNIHERGHEIGLHPSFNTYKNPEAIVSEAKRLRRICEEEGIKQDEWGGRMHYLRWETPTTLYGWEQAGMHYDSTLGYADRPGFRCGTCFEYPAFDPVAGEPLNLRIRPLIAMECSIIAERYLGLCQTEEAFDTFIQLKETCRKVKGCFTLLWHNSEFNMANKNLYKKIIQS